MVETRTQETLELLGCPNINKCDIATIGKFNGTHVYDKEMFHKYCLANHQQCIHYVNRSKRTW